MGNQVVGTVVEVVVDTVVIQEITTRRNGVVATVVEEVVDTVSFFFLFSYQKKPAVFLVGGRHRCSERACCRSTADRSSSSSLFTAIFLWWARWFQRCTTLIVFNQIFALTHVFVIFVLLPSPLCCMCLHVLHVFACVVCVGGGGGRGGGGGGYGGGGGGGGALGASLNANIQWDLSKLAVFEKNFYMEHPHVTAMGEQEVVNLRKASDMTCIGDNIPKPVRTFEEASFPVYVLDEIKKLGFEKPTGIQMQGWPMALSGRDMIGIAATGSGKTLAFILPGIVHINAQVSDLSSPLLFLGVLIRCRVVALSRCRVVALSRCRVVALSRCCDWFWVDPW
jgi:hypothetical protein